MITRRAATVGNVVFYTCTSLTDITFHGGITSIGQKAFYVPTTTATTINGGNDVVFAYDWTGDNRTLAVA